MAAQLSDTAAPRRIDWSTTDSGGAMDYFQSAYGTHIRFTGVRDGVSYTHSRLDAGLFAVDEVQVPLQMAVSQDPFNSLVVGNLHTGQIGRECAGIEERFGAGDVFINAEPSLPATIQTFDVQVSNVMLDLSVLAQVATTSPSRAPTRAPGPVRFTGFRPISGQVAANWKRTTNYLSELVANTDAAAQPLIRGSAARMLAVTALATFPNTALIEPTDQDRRDATSATVRRAIAIAFIEQHPDADLSVADIAAAANVSIRAVQVAFRRQLDTTPMAYLRTVRLDHVHRELLAATPASGATVTETATRWGFYNHNRFAASYRRAYGVPPRETLRTA